MNDNSLFLMKIEHRYNLQTNLTPCISNITELAVTVLQKNFRDSIKTCYNEINVILAEDKRVWSGSRTHGPWTLVHV